MSSFNSYVKVAKSTKLLLLLLLFLLLLLLFVLLLLLTGSAAATGKAAAGKLLGKLCGTAAAIADVKQIA